MLRINILYNTQELQYILGNFQYFLDFPGVNPGNVLQISDNKKVSPVSPFSRGRVSPRPHRVSVLQAN